MEYRTTKHNDLISELKHNPVKLSGKDKKVCDFSRQSNYVDVIKRKDEYHLWFSGTGMLTLVTETRKHIFP